MPDDLNPEYRSTTFEHLLALIVGEAYGTAFHMTHNQQEAEDLVQEAALRAFQAFGTFQEGTNFKAWFFRILINRFRNDYRKRKRAPDIAPLDDAPDLYLYTQTAECGLHARNEDPAAIVIRRMSEEQIAEAIAALPDEFRIVCILYFREEMAYQEIADIIDCPVGTVRSRLHRGRKILQKALWQVAREQGVVASLCLEGEKAL